MTIETDSAGVRFEYRSLVDLRPGDEIAGGWRPWAVVKSVECERDRGRVWFETHGPTQWFPLGESFPVIV